MTITRLLRPLILVGLMLGAAGVDARPLWPAPPRQVADEAPEGYLPGLSANAGRLCVKQCPTDDLPCDPPQFKVADGRCTTQWR